MSTLASAIHEIAGQITHKHISGYTYEISVVTYTKGSSSPADRCYLRFIFGDGDSSIVCRSNFEAGDPATDPWGANCSGNPDCSTHHMGQWTFGNTGLNIKKNVYTTTHTFPGSGMFVITVTDPLFEDLIVNISPFQPLVLIDTLYNLSLPGLPPFNNNPVYSSVPIDTATLYMPFTYNPGAVDPDGDSLSYSLITPPTTTGYFHPTATNSFGINATTGDVVWDTPAAIGKYIFCVSTQEWKLNIANSKRYMVATSMQIVSVTAVSAAGIGESSEPKMLINTYPNPSSSEIYFMVSGISDLRNSHLEIFDHTGRKVKSITPTELPVSFNASGLSSGIYYCQFLNQGHPPIQGKFEVFR